jgi:hypothetical protein
MHKQRFRSAYHQGSDMSTTLNQQQARQANARKLRAATPAEFDLVTP